MTRTRRPSGTVNNPSPAPECRFLCGTATLVARPLTGALGPLRREPGLGTMNTPAVRPELADTIRHGDDMLDDVEDAGRRCARPAPELGVGETCGACLSLALRRMPTVLPPSAMTRRIDQLLNYELAGQSSRLLNA